MYIYLKKDINMKNIIKDDKYKIIILQCDMLYIYYIHYKFLSKNYDFLKFLFSESQQY